MGSDLHMSPPTPDEHRIVRAGHITAVYSRHTDGIYGDIRTWTRKHHIDDPTEAAFKTLKATHPGWKVVTLPGLERGITLPDELSYEQLEVTDRDWDQEQRELESKVQRAKERAASAWEDVVAAEVELQRFKDERKAASE